MTQVSHQPGIEDATTSDPEAPHTAVQQDAGTIAAAPAEAPSFVSLGISAEVAAVLAAQGIETAFPIQAKSIPDALAGKDVCGKARTGQGKTLAFGLPLVERSKRGRSRRPRALVLTPTRELAVQVGDVLAPLAEAKDLRVDTFYGGTSIGRQIEALRTGIDIVVGTPGRLIDLVERNALNLDDVRTIVVDEADRMCDMGFFPQVEFIFQRLKHREQTLLFSATLDGQVNHLIKIYLREPVYHDVVVGDDADNTEMRQFFFQVTRHNKSNVAAAIGRGGDKVLMFTRTKRGADMLVKQLEREGVQAAAIHGDRRQESRERELARFSDGKLDVLVATNVAARGLHIEGIDVVVHYDPPEDPKDYVHRSGRTARAGKEGVVVTLALPSESFDMWLLQREIGMSTEPTPVRPDDPRLADLSAWIDEGA